MAHKMPPGVDRDHRFVDWVELSKKRGGHWAAGWFLGCSGAVASGYMLRKSVVLFNRMWRASWAGFSTLC